MSGKPRHAQCGFPLDKCRCPHKRQAVSGKPMDEAVRALVAKWRQRSLDARVCALDFDESLRCADELEAALTAAQQQGQVATLQAEIEALRAEVERLTFEMGCLRQQYDERTACMIVHRGAALACSAAVRAAYSEEHERAERLAEALRELRDLMLGQVKWMPCDCGCPQQRTPDGPHSVTWLRAAQQVEIAISKAEGKE